MAPAADTTRARRARLLPKISIQYVPKAPTRTPTISFPSCRCTATHWQPLRGLLPKVAICLVP